VLARLVLTNAASQEALHCLEELTEAAQPPLHRMEHALHGFVAFFVMPVFALANAGVPLGGGLADALTSPVALGIVAGLVVGKQLGITLFAWLAVKSGISELPGGVSWLHIYGASWLAAIGFTMSLFITDLAFADSPLLDIAKVGILTASIVAGVGGWLIIRRTSVPNSNGESKDS